MALPNGLPQISDLGQVAQQFDYVELPKIAVPFTTILNRAQIPDLSQDLLPRFAVDRISTERIYLISNEQGLNGQEVRGVYNDKFNLIRLVGSGWTEETDTNGATILTSTVGDYLEVTWYGTGLNMLTLVDSGARDYRVSIDGGSEGANFHPSGGNNIMNGRHYKHYQILNVASNLTLGTHTAKIRFAANVNMRLDGLELLNENSSGLIQLPPGSYIVKGQRRYHPALETTPYNSNFESGVLGTRGGRVIIYQKSDGSIAKSVQPTNSTMQTFTSADHTNEELLRSYFWREYGAGKSTAPGDDFVTLGGTASSRTFTLDDNNTALSGLGVVQDVGNDLRIQAVNGNFLSYTFTGTGLDVQHILSSGSNSHQMTVDGVSIGTFDPAANGTFVSKVVSGLPYGTHTVRWQWNTGNSSSGNLLWRSFRVYGPKKPTIPSDAKEIVDYNAMASFVANTVAGSNTISTGVLRKTVNREVVYAGSGWSVVIDPQMPNGLQFQTSTNGDYVEYTFYGTGFDFRFYANTAWNATITVDGSSNLSGFTTSFYGTGVGFTAATGALTVAGTGGYGGGLVVSNIALGKHTVRVTRTSGAAQMIPNTFDIITPVHINKQNGPFVMQGVMECGSQGLLDVRKFNKNDIVKSRRCAKTINITGGNIDYTTFGPVFCPVAMIKMEKDGYVDVRQSTNLNQRSVSFDIASSLIAIDGIAANNASFFARTGSNFDSQYRGTVAESIFLSKGFHTFQFFISPQNAWRHSGHLDIVTNEDDSDT